MVRGIETGLAGPPETILDIGTADGRMLSLLRESFPSARCVGLEYAEDLVAFGKNSFPSLHFTRGDAVKLPFKDRSIDAATAAAVIEHVAEPELMILECRRVLKPGGLLALTTPDPHWEKIATMVGHLKDDKHLRMFKLRELSDLLRDNRFEILIAEKFMLSPVGMPLEALAEKVVRVLHLDFMMANQLVVARKT
jgi:ubiquinone/menaquinone biosynthesis C-methylase UbiE